MKEVEAAARTLGLDLQPMQVRAAENLENAFSEMAKDRAGAFLVLSNPAIGPYIMLVLLSNLQHGWRGRALVPSLG